jgi:hypothetical protein
MTIYEAFAMGDNNPRVKPLIHYAQALESFRSGQSSLIELYVAEDMLLNAGFTNIDVKAIQGTIRA